MTTLKHKIRHSILKKRNNLTKDQVAFKSSVIAKNLISTNEFKKAKNVMVYIAKDNEVETVSIINASFERNKSVCAPCVNIKNHTIRPAVINCINTGLARRHFGIMEPKRKCKIKSKIDLIITPGIAFDLSGHRLGWGKAYYDKFLENMADTPKIGLAYEVQIVEKLPIDPHDVAMDIVITEKRLIRNNMKRGIL